MSENRNEANTTNRPHPALVNLLLFIESVVAELKSDMDDAAWKGTSVAYHARNAINHLMLMGWSVGGLTGETTPYFAAGPDGVNSHEARPQWGEVFGNLPEHWLKGGLSEGLGPDDSEFIMNMDR